MSPESHDDLDRALAAGLGGLAPDANDADAVLASMRTRLQRARTRHRLVRASAALGAFVVLGTGAVALAGQSTHKDAVSVAHPSTTTLPPTTSSTSTSTSTSTTRASTATIPRRTTVTTVPSAPHPTVPGGGTPPPATVPSVTNTTTAAPSELHTYDSDGGTMTVRFSGGRLMLVSYHAAAGYTAEVHRTDPDDVEVRFSGSADHRIRIRVENGRLSPEIR